MNTLPNIDYQTFFNHFMQGKPHTAITDGFSFADEMLTLFREGEKGLPMLWPGASGFKVRRKEVTVVSGINGHGKSNWMGQVLLDLTRQNEITCNLSMEMPPGRTLKRQCIQAVGEPPSFDYQTRFLDWTHHRLYLSDFDRPMTMQSVLGAIAWAATERNCTQIVVDSLMKCGINEDDYNGQKKFMDHLCEFAKSLDIHIWLIAHGRKKDDELKPMDKFDVKGTGTITDLADNVITIFRNKRKERAVAAGKHEIDKKPIDQIADALMRCDKQRHGDWEGTVPLNFHKNSGQFIPFSEKFNRPMPMLVPILDAIEPWEKSA